MTCSRGGGLVESVLPYELLCSLMASAAWPLVYLCVPIDRASGPQAEDPGPVTNPLFRPYWAAWLRVPSY